MQLKILSWNIWIDGNFQQIADFLKQSDADIIGLQEVQDDDPERPVIQYLTDLGYHHVFAPITKVWGGKTWNDGPAIFSKYPITATETYILSKEHERAATRADIQINGTIFHIFSTHFYHTHQQPSAVQEEQGANLIKVVPTDRTIVMGDFNAEPNSAVIQETEKVLVNSDPTSQPTWSAYPEGCKVCNPQDITICLDYIFTSKDILTKSFKVESSLASDHLPISCMIEV